MVLPTHHNIWINISRLETIQRVLLTLTHHWLFMGATTAGKYILWHLLTLPSLLQPSAPLLVNDIMDNTHLTSLVNDIMDNIHIRNKDSIGNALWESFQIRWLLHTPFLPSTFTSLSTPDSGQETGMAAG